MGLAPTGHASVGSRFSSRRRATTPFAHCGRLRPRWKATTGTIKVGLQKTRDERMTYDRSAVMRAVKSRDTGPERAVRAMLRSIAPGYRLHRADLPGKPDIVYAGRKLAIFVHGCFWHGHDCPRGARQPQGQRRLLGGQDRPQPGARHHDARRLSRHGLAGARRLRMRAQGPRARSAPASPKR